MLGQGPRRCILIAFAIVSLASCRPEDNYWRGDPARDAEAAQARGDYGPIALRDGDTFLVPGFPDSLKGLNIDIHRVDSVTLGRVQPSQRDSVIRYAAAYNAPVVQELLRVRAQHPHPPR